MTSTSSACIFSASARKQDTYNVSPRASARTELNASQCTGQIPDTLEGKTPAPIRHASTFQVECKRDRAQVNLLCSRQLDCTTNPKWLLF